MGRNANAPLLDGRRSPQPNPTNHDSAQSSNQLHCSPAPGPCFLALTCTAAP